MKLSSNSLLSYAVLLLATVPSAFGAVVTGTVTDKTSNKPSAGDDVVLISLAQKMQETTRTKTDASGHYRLDIPDEGMHLIRVDHQKAAYFATIAPGATKVDVTVYDVAPKIEGLSMEADMARIETDNQGLHVIESYFLKNDSAPPRTQFSPKSFEIYLPGDAKVDASIAMGPGGMPVASAPVPLGEPGHYAFVFPIRPGETRFQIEYHLPHSDSHAFQTKVTLPTTNYAVVLPQTMKLTPGNGAVFVPSTGDPNTSTMVAKNLTPENSIAFSVAGSGALPQDATSGQTASDNGIVSPSSSNSPDTRPGGGLAAPIDTPDPLDKYKWWIISGIGLILAVAAGMFLRAKPQSVSAEMSAARDRSPVNPMGHSQDAWLAGLKEELFALETERLRGTLSDEEYKLQKQALEVVMKRALTRIEKTGGTGSQTTTLESKEPSSPTLIPTKHSNEAV